jgi:hypothetical protein
MECEDGRPEIAHRVWWRRGFSGCGVEDAAGMLDPSSDGVGESRHAARQHRVRSNCQLPAVRARERNPQLILSRCG